MAGADDPLIARALRVLEALAEDDRGLALAEIAERTRLARSTAHRLLGLLEREQLVQRALGEGRYAVAPRLTDLSRAVLVNATARGERHAILQALVDEVGETCNLTMLDGNEVLYVDRVEAHWPLRLVLTPGSRVPLHCTASGKLFLALMPAARRQRLIAAAPPKRYTARTITDPAKLSSALTGIRAERLGTDEEEFLDGLIAVAVPVVGRRGRIRAAVAVHAPRARMSMTDARRHVPALRHAAERLAALPAFA
jgi:DNA-binding IclR family transcriptional regulator